MIKWKDMEYIYGFKGEYKGYFGNGVRSGNGKMKYYNGDEYEGLWSKDKRNGRGIEKKANGIIYEAFFLNDLKDWDGVKIENGKRIQGHFYNDEFTSTYYGNKKKVNSDGNVYDGYGEIIGRIDKNGNVYDKNWNRVGSVDCMGRIYDSTGDRKGILENEVLKDGRGYSIAKIEQGRLLEIIGIKIVDYY